MAKFVLNLIVLFTTAAEVLPNLHPNQIDSHPEDFDAAYWCNLILEKTADFERCILMHRRFLIDRATTVANVKLSRLISNYTHLHSSMMNETTRFERKFLLCEPYGGIGNVLAALASCFLVAVASGRAMLVSWDSIGAHRSWSPPYEVPLSDFLLSPVGLDWSFETALRKLPELQTVDPRADVHLSGTFKLQTHG